MADRSARSRLEFMRTHPVTCVFLWFFTVGQAIAFVPVIAAATNRDVPPTPFVVVSTLVGLLFPALVVTAVREGSRGLLAVARSALKVRVSARWYALALAGVPAVTLVMTVPFLGVPDDLSASRVVAAYALGLLLQTLLGLVVVNLAEEVAWTGVVQATLQKRRGPLVACLVTGPAFALQHLPLLVANGGSLAATVVLLLLLMVPAVPFRALMGWCLNSTTSLFMVALVHSAGNATAAGAGLGEGFLPRLYGPDTGIGPVHILALAILGVVVTGLTRGRLAADPTPDAAP